jgi:hypothetical protein
MRAIALYAIVLLGVAALGGEARAVDLACGARQIESGACRSGFKSARPRLRSRAAKRAHSRRRYMYVSRAHVHDETCPPYLFPKEGVCCARAGSFCWDPGTSIVRRNRSR